MKIAATILLFIAAIAALCIPWGGSRAGAVNVIGSTSVQPFAEMLSQEFARLHPNQVVDVQGGGSTAGVQATINGIADIGMCSRELKAEEKAQLTAVRIARDGLALVVHRTNPIDELARKQVCRLFNGEITNWKTLGGADRPVRLITREEGSGTREAFVKLVMGKARIAPEAMTQESNGAVQELVRHDPCAIGYMSLGLVSRDLKALRIDGKSPTIEAAKRGEYPLVRPFLFVLRGQPRSQVKAFVDYVLSPDAQRLLEKEGLVER